MRKSNPLPGKDSADLGAATVIDFFLLTTCETHNKTVEQKNGAAPLASNKNKHSLFTEICWSFSCYTFLVQLHSIEQMLKSVSDRGSFKAKQSAWVKDLLLMKSQSESRLSRGIMHQIR